MVGLGKRPKIYITHWGIGGGTPSVTLMGTLKEGQNFGKNSPPEAPISVKQCRWTSNS